MWNVDAQQMQTYHIWVVEFCYFMSVSNKISYLLISIMLVSQDKIVIMFTVKFKLNNIVFTIKEVFKVHLKNELNYTIGLCNGYMYISLFGFGRQGYHLKKLVAHNRAKIQHPTFLCRDIAFRIWCLLGNSHWSKWPKTFCGRCIS